MSSPSSSSSRSRSPSPEYELQSYWDEVYSDPTDDDSNITEWLHEPEAMLPAIEAELVSSSISPCRILHIGPGASKLSVALRLLLYRLSSGDHNAHGIINAKYSLNAFYRQISMEMANFGDVRMRHRHTDLMRIESVEMMQSFLSVSGRDQAGVGLIIDKSVSDCISCCPDYYVSPHQYRVASMPGPATLPQAADWLVPATYFLTMHLASLAAPGALWLCMSMSPRTFRFLEDPKAEDFLGARGHAIEGLTQPSEFWTLEKKELMVSTDEHTPKEYLSTMFWLRRTAKAIEITREGGCYEGPD